MGVTGLIDEARIWNYARTMTEIASSMYCEVPAYSTGLIACYNFNETSGTAAADATGHGYTGTLVGTHTWSTNYKVLLPAPTYIGYSNITGYAYQESPTVYWVKGGNDFKIDISHSANCGVYYQYFGFNKDGCSPNGCGGAPSEIKSYSINGTFYDWMYDDSYIDINSATCVDGDANCTDNDLTRRWNSNIKSTCPDNDYKLNTYLYDINMNGVGYTDMGLWVKVDNTAPTHDAVTVNDNCWITNGTNTYTITIKSTEPRSGFGGSYGMMVLINYDKGEPSAGGYFAWHPTIYVHTNDQMACSGGGYVSKASNWGGGRIDLISASTFLSGNQRTVVFTVRPHNDFLELSGTNKISMYTSDNCNNYRGWTLFDVNFTAIRVQVPTVSNSGPVCQGGTVNLTASGLAPAGQAINFSTGSFSYINVPHSPAYTLSTNSTIEAWIYPTSYTGLMIIYNKENSYEAEINLNGTLEWAYYNTSPGWAWINTGYTVPLNTWTHVAFVYDYTNSQFRTYINGILIHTYTISGTVSDPGNPLRIGNRSSNSPFYGRIDNVRIWNVARIASEIANSLYLEYPTGSTTGLVALYPLNGNANATVGTNGSLVNAGGASWITPTFYTYTWTGTNAPAASTNQTQTTGAMNTAGDYSYTVKASIGSCSGAASGSTMVTINGLPTFTVTHMDVSCFGGSDGSITVNILIGNAPYEYSSDNGLNYTAPPTSSTSHTFTGLNVAGSPYLIKVRDGNTCVSQQTCP
jgi:hypothetical protein